MNLVQLIRIHTGLGISLGLMAAGVVVCTLLAVIMGRSGASLRPIVWFGGLFALVVVPHFLGNLYIASRNAGADALRSSALANPPAEDTATGDRPVTNRLQNLFGPDVDPNLTTDARNIGGGAFESAESARFAVLPNGESVLLAQFKSSSQAEKAWVEYLRVSGLNQLQGTGDSQRGFVVSRPAGDRAYVLHLQRMVGVWTGANDEAIRRRMEAGGFEVPPRSPLLIATPAPGGGIRVAGVFLPLSPKIRALLVLGLVLYGMAYVFFYFKGAAWAGTYPAKPGVSTLSSGELSRRLAALNQLDVPFQVESGSEPNELFVTWKYADAKWIDLARVRGMKRSFRIRLLLDEAGHKVRATDYVRSLDWSAGRGGAQMEWKAMLGIVFFQQEHNRVLGLQIDDQGRFKPELQYAYTFKLNELKSPLIEVVTRAGWDWRPTVWQGPTWLRWLTE